jgi:hypothetical protein
MQPGAGGVSPPWNASGLVRARMRGTATPISFPRRADAESWEKLRATRLASQRVSENCVHHGGLTPAALVNVRLCIAKGVISPVDRTPCMCTRSGGRQPPVGNIRRCESETHIAGDMSRMQPGAGGVSPPWETSAAANRKRTSQAICRACNQERGASAPRGTQAFSSGLNARHCKCISFPRRADRRRSCWEKLRATCNTFPSHGGLTPRCACAQRAFTDDSRTPCTS